MGEVHQAGTRARAVPADQGGGRVRRLLAYLLAYLREVYTAPFRADPAALWTRSLAARERARRAALLRLILLTILGAQVFLGLPPALVRHASLAGIVSEVLGILADVLWLALNRAGQTTLAGLGFVYLSLGLLLSSAYQPHSGLDIQTLFLFALVTLYLSVAGLVLPRWTIWPTLGLVTVATVALVVVTPVAPGLTPAAAQNLRGLLIAFPTIYLVTVLLTWIAGRSSQSGMEAAMRALARERELAALKDQFIIDANHELRTPLMALYGSVELLATYGDRANPEQRARLMQRALTSGDTVLRLLHNVLDAGMVEAQAPHLSATSFALAPVVTSVLETFDPREIGESPLHPPTSASAIRPVTVDIPPSLTVVADEDRVRQVLINLVSNALKYSEAGTPLTMTAKALLAVPADHGAAGRKSVGDSGASWGLVQVSVRDYGLGVSPREAPKLFQRFVRLERDIAGPVRGTGVGLYLCRVLVEAMGGGIWVESTGIPGEGSTFSFTLPQAPMGGLSERRGPPDSRALRPSRGRQRSTVRGLEDAGSDSSSLRRHADPGR